MPFDALKTYMAKQPGSKALLHRMLFPRHDYRPRWWIRALVNPFVHTRRGVVRWRSRLDVVPFHELTLARHSIVEDQALINNVMGGVRVGRSSLIGVGSTVIGPVTIGEDVLLAQQVVLSALNHEYRDVSRPIRLQTIHTEPIVVADGAWIGAHAVVLPGIRIGLNSVVAAGSIVTTDVPDYAIVVGNPARIVRRYNADTGHFEREEIRVSVERAHAAPAL